MFRFLHWQFVVAPAWLITLAINLQHFLWRFFSAGFMLRTLVAPWRKDTTAYLDRSFTGLFTTFLLNQISRLIGCIIRSVMVLTWAASSVVLVGLSLCLFCIFLTAPVWILGGFVFGLQLILTTL